MKKIYFITQIAEQKLSKAYRFRFRWMLFLSMLVLATTTQAAVFTVSNTNDSGAGSLREAIDNANNTPGADIIEFATSGTITPQTALPNITEGLTIDGTTATGYTAGNPTITIEHNIFNIYALTVSIHSSVTEKDITISGIAIQKTAGNGSGIHINGGNANIAVNNNTIIENCIFHSLNEGIRINGSNDQTIRDNAFIGSGTLGTGNHCVELFGSSTDLLSMSGNTFAGGGNGIFITGIDNITVGPAATNTIQLLPTDNIQSLNGVPFIIQNASNIAFDDILSNPITTGFGFFTLTNCTNVSITNCDIDSRNGIVSLNNCNGVTVNDNIFRNASGTVNMTGGSDLTIQGNEFIACGGTGSNNWSVRLASVTAASTGAMNRVSWDNNSFDQCLNGIEIAGMPNTTISSTGTPEFKIDFEDRLFSSGAIIIRLNGSPNSSITDMDCTNRASAEVAFKLAVSVINSADITLDNLTFARYNNPVLLFGATNCTITNSLFKCNNVGIRLGTSANTGTTINGNNFDDNNFAIDNDNAETYDASNNYWGASDGSGTDGGSGDNYQGNLSNTTTFATTEFTGLPLLNPEIDITGNGNAITDGQTGTSTTDNTVFADTPEGQTTMNTFTIANTESDPLTVHSILSNTNDFEYTGSGFVVPGNSSVNVDINFSPMSTGAKSAIISVENDDCDEVSYSFQVSGLATAACDIAITSVATTNENCPNAADGTVIINATCTSCTAIQYSIDGGATFQSGNTFSNVASGTVNAVAQDTGDPTCEATDGTQSVGIGTDTEDPVITCPGNQNVDFAANCEYTLLNYTGMATGIMDNCASNPTVTQSPTVGTTITATQTITLTVSDGTNTADCTFEVIPTDADAPTLTCPADISVNTEPENCNQAIFLALPTVSDDCTATGDITINAPTTNTGITFDPFFGGYFKLINRGTYTVTYTATDDANNEGSCTLMVTVTDNEFPVFSACPQADVVEEADFDDCAADVQWPNIIADDNCSFTMTSTNISGDNFPVGTTPVTYTATDVAGNSVICMFNVVVEDATPPMAVCQDITVELGADGTYTLSPSELDNGSMDNCTAPGDLIFTANIQTLTCANTALALPVTLTVADATGNQSTCSSAVTIEDNIDPVALCQDYTAILDGSGNATVTTANIDNGSDDNCDFTLAITDGLTAYDCSHAGMDYVLTLTATDDSQNTATCTSTISVIDNENPTITCPSDMTLDNDAGLCGAVVNYTTPVGMDNCADAVTTLAEGLASGETFPIGTTDITYSVTDASGNTASCTFSVTVNDTEDPTITCPSNIEVDNDTGVCGAAVAYTTPVGEDNCPDPTTTLTDGLADGATFPIGITNVTYTVTDAANNTAECSFSVTVNDTELPTIECPDDIVVGNDTGDCSAVVDYVAPIGADNCPDAVTTLAEGPASGETFPIGTTDITYSVTDAAGNVASCTFSVTVNDTEDPTITCPSNVDVDNDAGVCGAVINYTTPVGADNCPDPATALTDGLASGSMFPVGTTNVTYQVTDASNNTASCSFSVTVNDTENPTITCPGDMTLDNDAGVCGAVVDYTTPVGADNCPDAVTTLAEGLASGETFPIGTTDITYSVTDAAGNVASCTFSVTVNDTEDPTIACPSDVVVDNDVGVCGAAISYTTPVGQDNCPDATTAMTDGLASGATFPVGMTNVTYLVTDASNNTAECSFSVTVNDAEAPTIVCPTDVVTGNDAGECGAVVNYTPPVGDDNCPDAVTTLAEGPASGETFPIGTTDITYSVTDAAGNVASCTFSVTVNDTENPTITCPSNIDVNNDAGVCGAVVSYAMPVGQDNCPDPVTVLTDGLASGATFPVGATNVTYEVTDASNNTASCSFSVTVNDTELPTIACPGDMTLDNDAGVCGAVVDYTTPVGADNCPDAVTTLAEGLASGETFPIGTTDITYSVTDAAGNVASCTFSVTVNDTEDPTIACPSDVVVDNDAGVCGAVISYTTPVGQDNCPDATTAMTDGLASGSTFPVGMTNVTYLVTDAFNNTASCSFSVTVNDAEAPTIVCPTDVVTGNDAGECGAVVNYTPPVGNDNCPDAQITLAEGPASGSFFPVGTTDITYSVVDAAGNTASCTFSVTVDDTEAPDAICQDITVQLDANGNGSTTPETINNGSNDNCTAMGDLTLSLDDMDFTCDDVAAGVTVTLTVADAVGNENTCTAMVTVEDNVNPEALCQDVTIQLDENGMASISTTDIDNGSNDACGVDNLSLSQTDFDCSHLGSDNTVTLTVEDVNTNTSTCTATVTVEDNLAPVITNCPTNMSFDALSTACAGSGGWTEPTVEDNCVTMTEVIDSEGVFLFRSGGSAFGTFPGGVTTISYTYTDGSGNESECSFEVTIEDNTPPSINGCPEDMTVDTDEGDCSAVVLWNAPTISDNCPDYGYTASHISGATFPVGSTDVSYTATDAAGNTASCTFTITVEDNEAPTVECPTAPIAATSMGNCIFEVPDLSGIITISDNCATNIVGIQNPMAGEMMTTTTMITYEVSDDGNNRVTCVVEVHIPDAMSVVTSSTDASCPDAADGAASITITGGTAPYTILWSNGATTESNDNIAPGSYDVQVTDANGCTALSTAVVEGPDNEAPVADCENITIQLDADGVASIVAEDLNDDSSDNCGIASFSVAVEDLTFECGDVGMNDVVLTVTDNSGNEATCTAVVTVEDVAGDAPGFCGMTYTGQLDADGNFTPTSTNLNIGDYEDNCGPLDIFVMDNPTLDCSTIDTPVEVQVGYTDTNNNFGNCTVNVIVEDLLAPEAYCFDILLDIDADGMATLLPASINNNSIDNCGIQSIEISENQFSCADIGENSVTLTVTDVNGFQGTCVSTVTVQDKTIPTPDFCGTTFDVILDESGNGELTADQLGTISDNCGTATAVPFDNFTVDCSDIGMNPQATVGFFDNNGNSNLCQVTLNVIDDIAPTAVCQNTQVSLDDDGIATVMPNFVNNNSSDACGIASITVFPDTYDCSEIGTHTVTLTVTDDNGNEGTCQTEVEIVDTTIPTDDSFCGETFPIDLDNNGNATFDVADLPVLIDNCGGEVSVIIFPSFQTTQDFTCDDLGANTVQLGLTDGTNSMLCDITVEINDPLNSCSSMMISQDNGDTETSEETELVNGKQANTQSLNLKSVQAYPNPFTTQVWIEYNLNTPAQTRISVYDATGQEVSNLLNRMVSSGNHRISWTPKDRPSGLYLVRVQVEDEPVQTIRIQLSK